MNDSSLRLERSGDLATLTIDRPQARNAINFPMLESLEQALDDLSGNLPRLLVIRAAEPGFCAGIDLKESREARSDFVRVRVGLMHRCLNRLRSLPCPVVAAINGVAVGLGCEIAISADLRIASPDARFCYPEPRVAVPSPSQHLIWLIGLARAQDMLLTARWIEAPEAERIGLATHIAEDLDRGVAELTDQIMDLAPLSMRRTKENLWITMTEGIEAASRHHQDGVTEAADTADRKEALQAFAEKRRPHFTGE
ncbi:MAG: enoyl-CoA hydratase/isomerase family protein [Sphaerobacteraceae bacterium]|nr:MAG: enoyl-CoA hydratase/isomerase family protein [Sphaerobacteraceae bacterium]